MWLLIVRVAVFFFRLVKVVLVTLPGCIFEVYLYLQEKVYFDVREFRRCGMSFLPL